MAHLRLDPIWWMRMHMFEGIPTHQPVFPKSFQVDLSPSIHWFYRGNHGLGCFLFVFCSPIPGRWSNLTSIFFKWVGSTTIQWWVFSSISVWNKQQVGHILWNRDHHQKSHFLYGGVAFLKSHIFGMSMSTSRMFQSLEPTTPSLNPCM